MLAKTASTPASNGCNSSAVSGPNLGGWINSQPAPRSKSNARAPTASTLRVRAVTRTFQDMGVECSGPPRFGKREEKPAPARRQQAPGARTSQAVVLLLVLVLRARARPRFSADLEDDGLVPLH